jgi:hypothetical protein
MPYAAGRAIGSPGCARSDPLDFWSSSIAVPALAQERTVNSRSFATLRMTTAADAPFWHHPRATSFHTTSHAG